MLEDQMRHKQKGNALAAAVWRVAVARKSATNVTLGVATACSATLCVIGTFASTWPQVLDLEMAA